MSYNYDCMTTFPGGLELGQLQTLVINDPGITTLLLGLSRNATDLTLTFQNSLSIPEQTALDLIINSYIFKPQPIINPTGSIAPYFLTNNTYTVGTTTFQPIGQMTWIDSRYCRYTNAVLVATATIYDRNLEWLLQDDGTLAVLGTGIITNSGPLSYSFVVPNDTTTISLQIRKTALGGRNPDLSVAVLEFVN